MASHNPVTIGGIDSSGNAVEIRVQNNSLAVASNVTVGTTAEIDAITDGYSTTVGVNNRFFNTTTGNEGYWSGTDSGDAGKLTYDILAGSALVSLGTTLSGEDQTNDVIRTEQQFGYETVAASQTNQVLGSTGAAGDLLHRLIVTVSTAATSLVALTDNTTSVTIVPTNTPIGVYSLELNAVSQNGAWKITTIAGSSVIAVGRFT